MLIWFHTCIVHVIWLRNFINVYIHSKVWKNSQQFFYGFTFLNLYISKWFISEYSSFWREQCLSKVKWSFKIIWLNNWVMIIDHLERFCKITITIKNYFAFLRMGTNIKWFLQNGYCHFEKTHNCSEHSGQKKNMVHFTVCSEISERTH